MAKPSFTDKLRGSLAKRNLNFKSVTAMVLFGMIILTFVFLGDYGSRNGGGAAAKGYAARVNGAYISLADLDSEVTRVQRSFGGMFGDSLGEQQRAFINAQAMQSLIQSELLAQYAEKAGIYATDHEVKEMIVKELPYFQQEGQFRRELYEQILAANRLTPADFESKLRKDRKTQRVREVMEASSSPLNLEIDKRKRLNEVQLSYSFAKLDKTKIVEGLSVATAEVAEKLKDPEFKKRVDADFSAHSERYDQPEEVRAAHILVKVDPANPASEAAALKKITELKKEAATTDFGALAQKNSEDAGSKATKGDLGFFGRGRMVPEFDAVAFTMPVGQVSDPVKSQFGYHLIKVLEKRAAKKAELATFENIIARRMIADMMYDADVTTLESKLDAKDMASVDAILKKLGVTWQDTGPVALSSEFIQPLGSKEATDAAFALTAENKVSRLVRDGTSKFIIQFKSETTKPSIESVQASALSKERAMDRLGGWLESLSKVAFIERNEHVQTSPLQ